VIEGLLGYHTKALRDVFDVRLFLAPPEELWKVQRDCSRRGYTTDQVLEELDRREPDSEMFIRPQRRWADIVVSFLAANGSDQSHLDAELALRDGLVHPDLTPLTENDPGIELKESSRECRLRIPGVVDPAIAEQVEEAVWDRMHFASHLRTERLGEFTIGTELERSDTLAIVQVLILYHVVTARATVALGGEVSRAARVARNPPAAAAGRVS
jgi:phosphoribulokinase